MCNTCIPNVPMTPIHPTREVYKYMADRWSNTYIGFINKYLGFMNKYTNQYIGFIKKYTGFIDIIGIISSKHANKSSEVGGWGRVPFSRI